MTSSVSLNNDATSEEPLAETSTTPTVTLTPAPYETRADGSVDELPRSQAGPLPRKRGEIGFQEGVHDAESGTQASSSSLTLPARHPADRENQPVSNRRDASPNDPPRSPSRAESTNTTSTTNTTGKRSLISFLGFKPKRIPTIGGLRLTTLAIFLLQLALFGVTLAGWVLVIKHMQKSTSTPPPPPPPSNPNGNTNIDTSTGVFSTTSAQIFVHVAFGIVTLAEAVFLERTIFRLRAERYAHVHPGEVLPRSRGGVHRGGTGNTNIALAPWNRPPLPTYAAALAQSGVGTGDVEDNIIAIPPPPAYGNTRGSRLLLQGFLSEALRAQRPRSGGETSTRTLRRMSGRSGRSAGGEEQDRPQSYMSTDPEWDARCDADRALVLEETLARLEEGTGGSRRS